MASNEEVITELFRRTRLSVDPKDPAFLIVTLNQIMLESHSDLIAERVSNIADGFESTAQRGADDLVEVINKASAVFQGQIVGLEAALQKMSVPEYVKSVHPPEMEISRARNLDESDSFKERFDKALVHAGVFALGLVLGLLIAGFMWVFFR